MESAADSRGFRYLLIDVRKRCGAADIAAVMRQLDSLLGPIDGREGVFSEWLAQHQDAVPTFGQQPVGDVLSDDESWKARTLAR